MYAISVDPDQHCLSRSEWKSPFSFKGGLVYFFIFILFLQKFMYAICVDHDQTLSI